MTAHELRENLIPKKIILRDCESFDGLDEYYFRVCVLKPEDNRYLSMFKRNTKIVKEAVNCSFSIYFLLNIV